jgi:hypothetical protein
MRQTEAISASDCPFRGSGRQHFSKKTHPASGKQPFHPLIHEMTHICARNKQHLATIQRPIFGKTGWRRGKTERTPVLAIGIRSVIGDLSFGRAPERGRSGMILEPDSREFFSWPGLDRGIFRCERVQPKKYLKKLKVKDSKLCLFVLTSESAYIYIILKKGGLLHYGIDFYFNYTNNEISIYDKTRAKDNKYCTNSSLTKI